MKLKKINILASFRDEETSIPIFMKRIENSFRKNKKIDYEIIFIDDYSNDGSLNILKKISKKNKKIKIVSFKKNYGGSDSISFGIKVANPKYFLCVIDCDLQDPPELISKYLIHIKNNELINFVRNKRDDGLFQRIYTSFAYTFLSLVSKKKILKNCNYFKIIPPEIVKKIQKHINNERWPYWNYFLLQRASKIKNIFYLRENRKHGLSKYGIFSLNPWITFMSGLLYFEKRFKIIFTIFNFISISSLYVAVLFFNFEFLNFLIILNILFYILFLFFLNELKQKKKNKINYQIKEKINF